MYEPKRKEIEVEAAILLEDFLADDDNFIEALIDSQTEIRALINAKRDDIYDALHDFKQAMERSAKSKRDFYEDARDMLIGQVGYTKQTDVDNYIFVAHKD